jgi:hypothetical protein
MWIPQRSQTFNTKNKSQETKSLTSLLAIVTTIFAHATTVFAYAIAIFTDTIAEFFINIQATALKKPQILTKLEVIRLMSNLRVEYLSSHSFLSSSFLFSAFL